MTGQSCTQPGCSGTIVDGYCDVCGTPPSASPLPGPGATGRASGTQASGTQGSAGRASAARGTGTAGLGMVGIGVARTGAGSATTGVGAASGTGAGSAFPDDVSGRASAVTRASAASDRLASAPIGSVRASTGSRTARRPGTGSTRMRGPRLGAGLTTVPSLPVGDPLHAVMKDPQVPEDRRFCPQCGSPVGRSRTGRPGRPEGFCPQCRCAFSFTPKLHAGDLVGAQYEVVGCLAHGGLGWIYLARDRNVSDRWVVLKGLLNTGDADAVAAAIAERQFLAQVEHPLIVEIYNFVTHDGAGYIVMEYVGGTSLKSLLKDRIRAAGGRYDAFPVDQAIAYVVEILPAFQYLHDLGLLYCDFKPDNIIQVGDAVRLIDLGGVRRIDDQVSAIYGTVGYQAPEVADVGPSVASDIYTIGRTLAVLTMEFRGYQNRYASSFPPVDEVPLFQTYDSFYRLLVKACAPDPADRFVSADELRVQLLGVLREIVASGRVGAGVDVAAVHSAESPLFDPPVVAGERLEWHHLPGLRVDDGDPMSGWLGNLSVTEPKARLEALVGAPQTTPEVLLSIARCALDAHDVGVSDTAVADLLRQDPWEWRAVWVQGLAQLAAGDPTAARASFNAVYGQVPGELAPKLALALACENTGELDVAERLYQVIAATDATYVAPGAFGMARIRAQRDDLDGAVAALDLIPGTSRAFVEARQRRAGLLARSGRGLPALAEALRSIETVTIEPLARARLTAEVLDAALTRAQQDGADPAVRIAGRPATLPELRDGLEHAYRELATLSADRSERITLVDQANRVRRWTVR